MTGGQRPPPLGAVFLTGQVKKTGDKTILLLAQQVDKRAKPVGGSRIIK